MYKLGAPLKKRLIVSIDHFIIRNEMTCKAGLYFLRPNICTIMTFCQIALRRFI